VAAKGYDSGLGTIDDSFLCMSTTSESSTMRAAVRPSPQQGMRGIQGAGESKLLDYSCPAVLLNDAVARGKSTLLRQILQRKTNSSDPTSWWVALFGQVASLPIYIIELFSYIAGAKSCDWAQKSRVPLC
jgi:hypothetical protein